MANEEKYTNYAEGRPEKPDIPVFDINGKIMGIINPDHSNVGFGFIPCGDIYGKNYDSSAINERIAKALGVANCEQELNNHINDSHSNKKHRKTKKYKNSNNSKKNKITMNCTIEINNY